MEIAERSMVQKLLNLQIHIFGKILISININPI